MQKIVLITGSTDGIGLETARRLVALGHHVLLHGRNPSKLEAAEKALSALPGDGRVESYEADLSVMADVEALGVTHMSCFMNMGGLTAAEVRGSMERFARDVRPRVEAVLSQLPQAAAGHD